MNCKDFEITIHELVSRRVADKERQLEALEHAGHCLWCAVRLDEESKLTEKLQAFASTLQGQHAPARVEKELLQAFRERNLRASAPLLGLGGKRLWRGLRWGLAFAAIVAAAWIIIFLSPRLHRGSSALPVRVANNQPPLSKATAANVAPGFSPAVSRTAGPGPAALEGGAASQVAHARSSERVALDESASEATTDFISLGTCDDSQCLEEATLVRVTLPAEALLAFGLETGNDYAPEGSVQADVALGSNGVPFAIRFVD
jgi:hypothetical protein